MYLSSAMLAAAEAAVVTAAGAAADATPEVTASFWIASDKSIERFLIVVERDLILALAQVEIAEFVVRRGHAAVVLGGGVEVERVA